MHEGTLKDNYDIAKYLIKIASVYKDRLKNFNESRSYIKQFLKYYPEESYAYELLGDNYAYEGDYDKSIEMYEIALTLDPNNIITGFQEKPMQPTGDLANAGIYWTSPKIFDYCLDKIPCDIGYDILPKLIGKMQGYVIKEYLLDIGTHQNFQRAQINVRRLHFSPASLEG